MTKLKISTHRVTPALWVIATLFLSACSGFQGNTYVRESDGTIGPTIPGVEITFTSEDGTISKYAKTNSSGWYRRRLGRGRYRVTATHLAFEPYDSAPGFFVVTGGGLQTANIFLQDLDATVVILVRHAEKASSDANTNLHPDPDNTGIGVNRAEALADFTANVDLSAIYVTEWCRTAQTGQPSAAQIGLGMYVLRAHHPSAGLENCNPTINVPIQLLPAQISSASDLAQHVLSNHAGQIVLIVGHRNTVAQLVEAFDAPPLCPTYFPLGADGTCYIPENEFNHMFILTVPSSGGAAGVVHETYGVP